MKSHLILLLIVAMFFVVTKSEDVTKTKQHSQHNHNIDGDHSLRNKRSPKKYNLKKSEHLFEKFQKKFYRNYENEFEKQKRYQIFKSNLLKINQLNKREQGTAKYGLTEFADMTTTEYKMRTGLLYDPDNNDIGNPIANIPNIDLPKEFDWRTKNVITEVKDQGTCGSCWAFSTVGNIEGLHAIKAGQLEEYSEQELVDCDTLDKGCQGGLMDNAYKAIDQLGGLELESEYPYEAHKDKCSIDKSKIRVKVKGGIDFPKNETAMALWLVKNGPISIGLNANAMMFYKGGISHPWKLLCRPGAIDHGVLIVGFGVAEFPVYNKTLPYWIIKNSWGKNWGEQGYYRIYRGTNACGVSEMASSAVLE
ncbi:putative cysteine proteinase CG12163 isoform X2 [Condylostylus longicornis]|uniref:putative cysteine proteinase CG12163 isoform X2 n=1 Tax=Condylostylus longicornis TaxID=2530218 RepID=UPI00244E5650|nr:putative cysteine proteinase CG12163 isoform X2 [Condylostylus longicornis]